MAAGGGGGGGKASSGLLSFLLCVGQPAAAAAAAAVHILGRHLQLTHPGRLKRTGTPVGGEGGVKKGEGGLFRDFLALVQKRQRCILPTRAGHDSYRGPTWDPLA